MSDDDKNKPVTEGDESLAIYKAQEIIDPKSTDTSRTGTVGEILKGVLSRPELKLLLGGDPKTLEKWGEINKREGEIKKYVSDQDRIARERECITRDGEAIARIECSKIEEQKETAVAVATHEVPSKHRKSEHALSWFGTGVLFAGAIAAAAGGILPATALGGVLIAIVAAVGVREGIKEFKKK